MNRAADNLARKLEDLSQEQLNTVEEFVEFLRMGGEDRALVRAAGAVSEPAFTAIWDNPEDYVYDSI